MKKIPDHAKKVFEGVIFDVYHWGQEMFDGSVETFEAIKKRDAVFVLATCDGEIAVNHEQQPSRSDFVSLPGGLSEKNQPDMLSNAKRELMEEVGFQSDNWDTWFDVDQFNHPKIDSTVHYYIATNCKKTTEQKLDPGEKIQTILITFEEFLELRNNPKFRNKDLVPLLEKAAGSEEEKQKLKEIFGIKD